jgi:CheY-like chemotaxis protein
MSDIVNILLVDDNDFILLMLEKYISECPEYKVFKVTNGQEAMNILSKHKFDLVVTDILMPEKDGIELINEIRKMKNYIPVIAISGGDEGGDTENYINFACYFADETLTKPVAKREFLDCIRMLINQDRSDFLQLL